MKHFQSPLHEAFVLAQKMRRFRRASELTAFNEGNINADNERNEVVRQIDWSKFNDIIAQLESCVK